MPVSAEGRVNSIVDVEKGAKVLSIEYFYVILQRRVLYGGVPLVECSNYLVLSPKGEFLRTLRGVPLVRVLSLPCFSFKLKIFTPLQHPPNRPVYWVFSWLGVLPFGTLDHVRTIIFKFLVL